MTENNYIKLNQVFKEGQSVQVMINLVFDGNEFKVKNQFAKVSGVQKSVTQASKQREVKDKVSDKNKATLSKIKAVTLDDAFEM